MNYLLSASLAMAVFYALYAVAFRRLRFHGLNRAYLLGSLGLSLVIPLVELPAPTASVAPLTPERVFAATVSTNVPLTEFAAQTEAPKRILDWQQIIWVVYLLGVAAMALRLTFGLGRLAKLARQPGRWEGGLKLIPTSGPNASFFNLIFLNETGLNAAERAQVLAHEAEHARLHHSADRLLLEALRVAFWFNPVPWLYQRSLAHLHELQVDERVARCFEARAYAKLLLRLHGSATLPLANLFSRQPLKDRLASLFQPKPTSKMKKWLYLAVVPVALTATLALAQAAPAPRAPVASAPPAPPTLDGAYGGVLFLAKPRVVSMYLNSKKFDPDFVKANAGQFDKIGFQAEVSGVVYDAKGKIMAAHFILVRKSDGKTVGGLFRVGDLLRSKRHVNLYANETSGLFYVRSVANSELGNPFPDVKPPRKAPPVPKVERQGKVILKAPTRVVAEDIPTSAIEPAGYLELKNGRATAYLNLNRYDPDFIETAKRFFQSNGAELKVTNERIDVTGKLLNGDLSLVKKGGTATVHVEESDAGKESRWVYLQVYQQSGGVSAGGLPHGFQPSGPKAIQPEKASYLPSFLFWPFRKNDDC